MIDNNPGDRHLIGTILRHKGYEVLLAENGQKGLELFRRVQPDVIVLDLKLDEMDGLTVLRHIRSLNRNQRVIIYSGGSDPKTEQTLLPTSASLAHGIRDLYEIELSGLTIRC